MSKTGMFKAGFLFSMALVASSSATMWGDVLQVPKTQIAPVLDGVLDGVWQNVTEEIMTGSVATAPEDWFDCFATFRLMWDGKYLYGFLFAYDNIIDYASANTYEQDSFELYFDADNSKCPQYDGVNDIQLRLHYQGTTADEIETGFGNGGATWPFVKDNIEYVNRDMDNGLGWTSEFKIPLADLMFEEPYPWMQFGLEIQYNDNDGAARESNLKWWLKSGADDSWFNPSIFGTAQLSTREVNEILDVQKSNGFTPTIDGTLEDGWLDFPEVSDNTYCMDTAGAFDETTVDDWTDSRFHFWTIWDDTKLYAFVKVWDDVTMYDAISGNSYESDGIEVYFDGDNSKGETYDGVNDNQIRFERKDTSSVDIDATAWFDKSSVLFANRETDTGWNLEFSIPLADCFIDNTIGTIFGFEMQMNDCDTGARDGMRRWWSWDNLSWANPSKFGEAELISFGTLDKVESAARLEKIRINPCEVDTTDTVSVRRIEDPDIAKRFLLAQNFPNPFNPSTRIMYSLSNAARIRLSLYDTAGREVAVLVNEVKAAGVHDIRFDTSDLPSGVYFYRLKGPDGIVTRKMTLMR
jgi:hypothetical protein